MIYADPPWEFRTYSEKGYSPKRHYDTMPIGAIKALPILPLAADDCTLFLWCTMPQLPGELEVIGAWGFAFKTAGFVWVKQNPSGEGLHTVCLLATRGSPQRIEGDVHQIIMAPVGAHSAKPQEARRRIERLLLGPYLELFARGTPADGWRTWGNEVEALEAVT